MNKQPISKMSLPYIVRNVLGVVNGYRYFRRARSLGRKVRLFGREIYVTHPENLIIGDRVRFISTITSIELGVGQHGLLEIGEGTYINYGVSIAALEHVIIGKNCNIGTYVIILDNNFHQLSPETRNELPPSKPVHIADNVWLGARVIVLPGVTIGEGSVIAAGSVVTRDISPRTLAAGQPALPLKKI